MVARTCMPTISVRMAVIEIVIVEIKLGRSPDGNIARHGPFMVFGDDADRCGLDDADRCGLYDKEPDVIAQLGPGEDNGLFEATWDGEWKFGRRVQDA
jgi:hypothetical protein